MTKATLFLKMVKQVKALREELDRLIDKGDLNAQIATKFLTYIRLLNYYELYRVLIQTIDTSFIAITNTRDFSPLIYAQILHIKTEALWHLNESVKLLSIKPVDTRDLFFFFMMLDKGSLFASKQ